MGGHLFWKDKQSYSLVVDIDFVNMKLFQCWWSKEVSFITLCSLTKHKANKEVHKMEDKRNEYSCYPICILKNGSKYIGRNSEN